MASYVDEILENVYDFSIEKFTEFEGFCRGQMMWLENSNERMRKELRLRSRKNWHVIDKQATTDILSSWKTLCREKSDLSNKQASSGVLGMNQDINSTPSRKLARIINKFKKNDEIQHLEATLGNSVKSGGEQIQDIATYEEMEDTKFQDENWSVNEFPVGDNEVEAENDGDSSFFERGLLEKEISGVLAVSQDNSGELNSEPGDIGNETMRAVAQIKGQLSPYIAQQIKQGFSGKDAKSSEIHAIEVVPSPRFSDSSTSFDKSKQQDIMVNFHVKEGKEKELESLTVPKPDLEVSGNEIVLEKPYTPPLPVQQKYHKKQTPKKQPNELLVVTTQNKDTTELLKEKTNLLNPMNTKENTSSPPPLHLSRKANATGTLVSYDVDKNFFDEQKELISYFSINEASEDEKGDETANFEFTKILNEKNDLLLPTEVLREYSLRDSESKFGAVDVSKLMNSPGALDDDGYLLISPYSQNGKNQNISQTLNYSDYSKSILSSAIARYSRKEKTNLLSPVSHTMEVPSMDATTQPGLASFFTSRKYEYDGPEEESQISWMSQASNVSPVEASQSKGTSFEFDVDRFQNMNVPKTEEPKPKPKMLKIDLYERKLNTTNLLADTGIHSSGKELGMKRLKENVSVTFEGNSVVVSETSKEPQRVETAPVVSLEEREKQLRERRRQEAKVRKEKQEERRRRFELRKKEIKMQEEEKRRKLEEKHNRIMEQIEKRKRERHKNISRLNVPSTSRKLDEYAKNTDERRRKALDPKRKNENTLKNANEARVKPSKVDPSITKVPTKKSLRVDPTRFHKPLRTPSKLRPKFTSNGKPQKLILNATTPRAEDKQLRRLAGLEEDSEENYEITPLKLHSDPYEYRKKKKTIPTWAQGDGLQKQLEWTERLDPDKAFKGYQNCDVDNLFPVQTTDRKRRRMNRGSSANWGVDGFNYKDHIKYKLEMGYI